MAQKPGSIKEPLGHEVKILPDTQICKKAVQKSNAKNTKHKTTAKQKTK